MGWLCYVAMELICDNGGSLFRLWYYLRMVVICGDDDVMWLWWRIVAKVGDR